MNWHHNKLSFNLLPLKSLSPEMFRFIFFFIIASVFSPRFGFLFANDAMGNLERGTNQRTDNRENVFPTKVLEWRTKSKHKPHKVNTFH